MGRYIMKLTTERQLTGVTSGMSITVFAFSRKAAERKLQKLARSCYGENFTVSSIDRA
jgi:hypothetical protein